MPSNQDPSTFGSKYLRFSLSPKVGYFIADKLEAGLSSSYANYLNEAVSNQQYGSNSTVKDHTYSIGIYLRKYFMLTDKIALNGTAELYYSLQKNVTEYIVPIYDNQEHLFTSKRTTKSIGLTINPGITFFPNDKIGLGAAFGNLDYSHYNTNSKSTDSSNTESSGNAFGLNLSSSSLVFTLGYYISR